MRRRQRLRNQKGVNAAEFAAVCALGLPLITLLIFVTLECTRFFTIKSAMELGARNAARALVVDYNKTSAKNTNTSLTWLRMPNYIANNNQFIVDWDAATPPTYVTVTCTYPNDGSYGLTKFPAGPLRYLSNSARWDLKTFNIKGTFTVPVQ